MQGMLRFANISLLSNDEKHTTTPELSVNLEFAIHHLL